MEKNTILEIRNMNISFCQYQKGTKQTKLPVIKDLSLTVHQGEMVAVVGSSGSGKSLLAHGVMGILPYKAKRILKEKRSWTGSSDGTAWQKKFRSSILLNFPEE